MMPSLKQRALVVAAMIVAGLCYGAMADAIDMGNGSGSSLLAAYSPSGAVVSLVIYSIPALVLAVLVAAAGNPLSGYGVLAAGMLVPAWQGGPIDDWLRAIDSPGSYRLLAVESLVWALPFVALTLAIHFGRERIRKLLPGFVRSPWCHEVPDDDPTLDKTVMNTAGMNVGIGVVLLVVVLSFAMSVDDTIEVMVNFAGVLVIALVGLVAAWGVAILVAGRLDETERTQHRQRIHAHLSPAFFGGAMSLTFGTIASFLLLLTSAPGQAIGSIFAGFIIGSFLAHQAFPSPVRATYVFAPILLGAAAFLYTSFTAGDSVQMLQRFYGVATPGLPAPALTMPATFASAGVLGSVMGVGWSQGVFASREEHVALTA